MTLHDMSPPLNIVLSDEIIVGNLDMRAGEGKIEMSYGLPGEGKFRDDMLAVRQDFVVNVMKWRSPDTLEGDDQYDQDPGTLHIGIRQFEDESLIAGVRLSRPRSLDQVMSLTMLNENALRHVAAEAVDGLPSLERLQGLAERGLLRDMTRLVADRHQDPAKIVPSMMELFGYAAGQVRNEMRHDTNENVDEVKWIFATTEKIRFLLMGMGVQIQTLVGADFSASGDEKQQEKSYLCLVDQESAIKFIQDRPEEMAYSLVPLNNGLHKANAL